MFSNTYDFENWNIAELFDFVRSVNLIDSDEKVENWDRISLLELLTDYKE